MKVKDAYEIWSPPWATGRNGNIPLFLLEENEAYRDFVEAKYDFQLDVATVIEREQAKRRKKPKREWLIFPTAMRAETRQLLAQKILALQNHPNSACYWKMLGGFLKPILHDEETGEIAMPYDYLRALLELPQRDFCAEKWLKDFSRDVFPIEINQYTYIGEKCRTVVLNPSHDIKEVLDEERLHMAFRFREEKAPSVIEVERCFGQQLVDVPTGKNFDFEREDECRIQEIQAMRKQEEAIPQWHPGYGWVALRMNHPHQQMEKVFRSNRARLEEEVRSSSFKSEFARNSTLNLLARMGQHPVTFYKSASRSPRLFPVGASPLYLPSRLRNIAFAGCHSLDLKLCQLAIVAKIWDIPSLHAALKEHLRNGTSLWDEWLEMLGLDASYKASLKTAVYSIVFGMAKQAVIENLAEGTTTSKRDGKRESRNLPLGLTLAKRFIESELVADLFKARNRAKKQLINQWGGQDACGNRLWLPQSSRDANGNKVLAHDAVRSMQSYIVQSYEMKLILSLIPVISQYEQIYFIALIHDGVIVRLGNKTKEKYDIGRMKKAVVRETQKEASACFGIPTCLECEAL